MHWMMDAYLSRLGWEAWLLLCAVLVVLWAVVIAGATALFQASAPMRSDYHQRMPGSGDRADGGPDVVGDEVR